MRISAVAVNPPGACQYRAHVIISLERSSAHSLRFKRTIMARIGKPATRAIRRAAVVKALIDCGWSVTTAAKVTGEQPRFVKKWRDHFLLHKNLADKRRPGRKELLSTSQQDTIPVLLAEHQSLSKVRAILVSQHGMPESVSVSTIYRAAKKVMEQVAPVKQPLLTAASRSKRVAFGEQELDDRTDWTTVMAIDSTYFTLHGSSPRRKYWVMKGQKVAMHKPNKSQQLHVYGGISVHGKTPLFYVSGTTGLNTDYKRPDGSKMTGVGAEEFIDMLEKQLVPAAQQIFAAEGVTSWTLLLDKAPAHTPKVTKQYFAAKGIKIITNWPGNSPDLNPIENAWAVTKQDTYSKQHHTLEEQKAAVNQAWQAISITALRNLMLSIPRRLQKMLKLKGGYTGY